MKPIPFNEKNLTSGLNEALAHAKGMKLLTVSEAKKDLSKWLRLARNGHEIGIVSGNTIVAICPIRKPKAYPRKSPGAPDRVLSTKAQGKKWKDALGAY